MLRPENQTDIASLRARIDEVDSGMLELFEERMELASKVGEYKRLNSLPVTDIEREEQKLSALKETVPAGLVPASKRLMRLLIDEAKTVQRKELNIYLIGMPDCGKTRFGKLIAKKLDMTLVDTDKLIMQRMDMSIDDIFSGLGEEAFRSMETMALVQTVKKGGCVVATGGGLPLGAGNAKLMKNSGVTVFLDRKLEALLGQSTKNRPLLRRGGDVNANITALYNTRRSGYIAAADIIVDPDAEGSVEAALAGVEEILSRA